MKGPTPERRVTLQNYLRALGIGLHLSDDPTPGEIQTIALATKDRPDVTQIHTMLLRSMQQAVYTSANAGHFGLAYGAYAHFTSPIRRYPDLLVHRVIKAILGEKRYQLDAALVARMPPAPPRRGAKPGVAKPAKAMSKELETWEAAGAHCSANERRADEASRDVEAWLKCRFMREHLGEEYAGTVSAITSFGLFVTLDALYVEGLVHITELGGEYYRYDEVHQELRGERSGARYAVGTRVRVQVSRVDLDSRRIDFRLVRDGETRLCRRRALAANERGRKVPSRNCRPCRRSTAPARRRFGARLARRRLHPAQRRPSRRAARATARHRRARAADCEVRGGYSDSGRAAATSRISSVSCPARTARPPGERAHSRSAARPCSQMAACSDRRADDASPCVAASCAQKPPTHPASTSPVPPLASRPLPVGLITRPPSAEAMTLPEPLSNTTQPWRCASVRAASRRSTCTAACPAEQPGGFQRMRRQHGHLAARGAGLQLLQQGAVAGDDVECVGVQQQPRAARQQRRQRIAHGGTAAAAADHGAACQRRRVTAPPSRTKHQLRLPRVAGHASGVERADEDPPGAAGQGGARGQQCGAGHAGCATDHDQEAAVVALVAAMRAHPQHVHRVRTSQHGRWCNVEARHAERIEPDLPCMIAARGGEQPWLQRQQ